MVTVALLSRSFDISIYAFLSKSLQLPSVKDVTCQKCTTVSQSLQWAFTLESTIHHAYSKERSDEGD